MTNLNQLGAALIVTNDGIAYVADSTSCRIRRVTPASLLSVNPTCEATCDSLTRSSGCASYDPPVNEVDLKVTPAQGYIYNNHKYRDEFETEFGIDYVGRTVKDCVGSPPVDRLDKKWWNDTVKLYPYNYNLVIDDYKVDTREDPEDGITIKVSERAKRASLKEDENTSHNLTKIILNFLARSPPPCSIKNSPRFAQRRFSVPPPATVSRALSKSRAARITLASRPCAEPRFTPAQSQRPSGAG